MNSTFEVNLIILMSGLLVRTKINKNSKIKLYSHLYCKFNNHISTTKLRYGEVKPKGVLGRIFGVIWMTGSFVMISLIMSIIISTITLESITGKKDYMPINERVGIQTIYLSIS